METNQSNAFNNQGPAFNSKTINGNVNTNTTIYNNTPIPDQIGSGINFRVSKPETNFIGRTDELNSLNDILCSMYGETIVVSGMGGVGKTQLVRKFIAENRSRYKNVIWIDSENVAQMKESFEDLAGGMMFRLPMMKANGEGNDLKFLIERVVNILCQSRTLFVYDNVYSFQSFKFILALAVPKPENLHILITTYTELWPTEIDFIPLKVLSPMESIEFVNGVLKEKMNDENISEKIELVKTLQYFPLALRQATTFINEKRKGGKIYTISQFIVEYTRDACELLTSIVFQEISVIPYNKTTFTTWDSAVEAIREDAKNGKLAIRIFRIASYFAAHYIETDVFFHLTQSVDKNNEETSGGNDADSEELEEFKERVRSAVELLAKHCMVNNVETEKGFSIHRLVQQVTRLKLKSTTEGEMILRDALELMERVRRTSGLHSCDSHWIAVFLNASKLPDFVAFLANVPVEILKNLTNARYSKEHIEFGDMISGPLAEILGENNRDLVQIRQNVSYAHMMTGSYEKSLRMFLDIHKTQQTHFGETDSDTRQTQVHIAHSYKKLQNFDEALEWYERAVETHKISFGENDIRTHEIMFELAYVYMHLRKHAEAFQLFEEIYEIEKIIFGKNEAVILRYKSVIAAELSILGKHSEALRLFEYIYEKRKAKYGEDDWRTRSTKYEIAIEYGKLGRIWKGFRLLEDIYLTESLK